jgi:hypothetical protein
LKKIYCKTQKKGTSSRAIGAWAALCATTRIAGACGAGIANLTGARNTDFGGNGKGAERTGHGINIKRAGNDKYDTKSN